MFVCMDAIRRERLSLGRAVACRATERGWGYVYVLFCCNPSPSSLCTSQQILDTNHKKIYNKKLSVSQISVRNATCDIELASDSLTNKLDAVH